MEGGLLVSEDASLLRVSITEDNDCVGMSVMERD